MGIHIGGKVVGCNINDANGVTQVMTTTSDGTTTSVVSETTKKNKKKTGDESKPTFSGMNIFVGGKNVTQVITGSKGSVCQVAGDFEQVVVNGKKAK